MSKSFLNIFPFSDIFYTNADYRKRAPHAAALAFVFVLLC